jgi:hypothetical protein
MGKIFLKKKNPRPLTFPLQFIYKFSYRRDKNVAFEYTYLTDDIAIICIYEKEILFYRGR